MTPAACRAIRIAALLSLVLLHSGAWATSARAGSDIGCGDPDDTKVVCPDDEETARYIERVTSTSWGVSILLTDEGVTFGQTCEGARRIVTMASDLYASLPGDQRLRDDLLWANPGLTREVFAHAWGAGVGIDNGNPVDIVFGDYTGDGATWQAPIWNGPFSRVLGCDG